VREQGQDRQRGGNEKGVKAGLRAESDFGLGIDPGWYILQLTYGVALVLVHHSTASATNRPKYEQSTHTCTYARRPLDATYSCRCGAEMVCLGGGCDPRLSRGWMVRYGSL
jgi:hypothetical protein